MVVGSGPGLGAAVLGLGGAIGGRSGLFAAALGLAAVAGGAAAVMRFKRNSQNVICYSQ